MSADRRRQRWLLWTATGAAAVAALAFTDLPDLAREVLGALVFPSWCTLRVDEGLSRRDFRIDFVSRETGVRATVVDGGRYGWVPPDGGGRVFEISYRGELVCVAGEFNAIDFALDTYGFRCSARTGPLLCSADRAGAPVPMSCHDLEQPERLSF